jgi:integrase
MFRFCASFREQSVALGSNWKFETPRFRYSLLPVSLLVVRIHDLRHTFATHLIQNKESPAYVQQQLGHHSIQITVDIYGHLVPGGNKRAVDRLDDTAWKRASAPAGVPW